VLTLVLCSVAWERIFTINDFWDCPRLGVAQVFGRPHIYESPFNSLKDDFEDFYLVCPIDPDLLALVLEDWEIWNRYSEAFDRGEVSREDHPALPQDRPRHTDIKGLIGTRLRTDPSNCRKLRAEFRRVGQGWNGMEVQWSESHA
jgi:hypothetical protein